MFINKKMFNKQLSAYVRIWYLCRLSPKRILTSELTSLTDLHHRVRDQSQPPIQCRFSSQQDYGNTSKFLVSRSSRWAEQL